MLLLSTPCHDHSHLCETQDCQTQLHTYQTHVGMVTYLPTLPNTAPYHIHSVAICVCVCVCGHMHIPMYTCTYTDTQPSTCLHTQIGSIAMANLLKSRDITLLTKVHIVKAMVFPIVMYSCERWNIKRAESRRTDAFELWCWRRLLRVPGTARKSKKVNPKGN